MPRLSSKDALRHLRELLLSDRDTHRLRIAICAGTACRASGACAVIQAVKAYIIQHNLQGRVAIQTSGCHGFCEMGPFMLTVPQGAFYTQVKPGDVPRIMAAALSGGYEEDLLYRDTNTGQVYHQRDEIPFFKHQKRTILDMSQWIDPTRIYDYIVAGGLRGPGGR